MPGVDDALYLFGSDAEEHARLRRQAAELAPGTARLLDLAGVPSGGRCIDVGCGTGAVMDLLAERVGPAGEVVGVDRDPAAGAAADRAGPGPVRRVVIADVDVQGGPPGGPADVVTARLLLFHVDDPVGVIARLATWVRPGGVLVLQDYDCGPMGCTPPHPAADAFAELLSALVTRAGRDPRRGAALASLLVRAGLGPPDGLDGFVQVTDGAAFGRQRADALRSLLPAMVAAGLTTTADGRALEQQLRAMPADDGRLGYSPVLVGAWWRRLA